MMQVITATSGGLFYFMQITIDPEFKALIPPLAPEELAQLENNIITDGCRDPLVVWNGILIDGHNRYEICTRHSIEFHTVKMEFGDQSHAIEWIIKNQFGRRNLLPYIRTKLALRLEETIASRAKENLKTSTGGSDPQPLQKSANPATINTRAQIAKVAGVSHDTVAKVKKIEAFATDQVKAKLATGEVSINEAFQDIKSKQRLEERHVIYTEKTKAETKAIPPTISLCDCIEWLEKQEPSDLLITDPPYSTDVEDIDDFAAKWLPLALSKVKSTGRAYVCVGAYPNELAAYMKVAMPTQVLVWTYRNTLGPSPSHGYKLNWQAILYYQMPDAPPLNCPIMIEQFSVQDINAPDGRLGDRYHAWQKPLELAERLVRHSTKAGDTVIDPFACTGTFLLAASKLGRIAKGCDIDGENIKIAINRGCVDEK